MVKTFKRIAALAMAIALVVCFAVSASADVAVNTTTTYVTGDNTKVNVSVSVTGATGAEYITYYATNGSTKVYIDQSAATGGAATFNFQTAAENLDSTVKVGYTGASAAKDSDVTANTVKYGDTTLATLPTATTTATVTIAGYEAEAGKDVVNVEATNATVDEFSYENNNIAVELSAISGDVVLTVTEGIIGEDTSAVSSLDAAGITVKADDETAVAGNRKLTVLGAATGTDEYGVIISTGDIATAYTNTEFEALRKTGVVYEAKTKGTNGVFAVQVVDEATDGEKVIAAGTTYNVAVYVKMSNGTGYKVTTSSTVTVGQ